MRVGWVGLGKLGLPCALALDNAGHSVVGTDRNPAVRGHLTDRNVPYREDGVDKLLATHNIEWADRVSDLTGCDLVFVAVQTPHVPALDGSKTLTGERADFEYGYLVNAVRDAAKLDTTLVVVSTVLPGTFDTRLRHLCRGPVVYNPFFIAMGTTVADFTNPEFVLLGSDRDDWCQPVEALYRTLHDRPIVRMSIPSAELTKVAYNTFIGMKIGFVNLLAELAEHTGADVDQVTEALRQADQRITSGAYMTAGVGDGGGCHPRDNLALSWLAQRLGLHSDLFGYLMQARENHSKWLAGIASHWAELTGMEIVLLGKSYKPGSNLELGSPAHLLASQVRPVQWVDPHIDGVITPRQPCVYVIATAHPEFADLDFPEGSVVVDPFGYLPRKQGVTWVTPGRR